MSWTWSSPLSYRRVMRAMRIITIGALLTAVGILTSGLSLAGEAAEIEAIFRQAIAFEKAAADDIPFDFEAAKAHLEEAKAELDKIGGTGRFNQLATAAIKADQNAISAIDAIRADGQVTEEEMSGLNWILRQAMSYKDEAIWVNQFSERIAAMLKKKWARRTPVAPPNCRPPDQGVRTSSTCFTVDTWKIFIDRGAREALCKFVDGDGRELTNLRPLFEDVIQDISCKLTDKTVVVNGVRKRVVRATLELTTHSDFDPRGTANVRVVAHWR